MATHIEKFSFTTDGSGDATETRVVPSGRLLQLRYVVHATTPFATGFDLTITGAITGYVYYTLTNGGTSSLSASPRVATTDVVSVDSLYAGAGEPVEDYMYVGGEKLVVTVAQGGDTKIGDVYLWIG